MKRKEPWTKDASELLHNIYDCDYSANMTMVYLNSVSKGSGEPFGFKKNTRFWNVCNSLLPSYKACVEPQFITSVCTLFPIR